MHGMWCIACVFVCLVVVLLCKCSLFEVGSHSRVIQMPCDLLHVLYIHTFSISPPPPLSPLSYQVEKRDEDSSRMRLKEEVSTHTIW